MRHGAKCVKVIKLTDVLTVSHSKIGGSPAKKNQ